MYKGSPFSTFSPTFVVSCLFDIAFLTAVRWEITVVLICISIMIHGFHDVERLFMCLLVPVCFYLEKCLMSCPFFKSDFFCYWVIWILYVFFILTSYQIQDFESFLPFYKLPLHFGLFPLLCRSFLVWWHLTCLFLLLLPLHFPQHVFLVPLL